MERLATQPRDGRTNYEYQIVFPIRTPMRKNVDVRHFTWIVKSVVSESYFDHDGQNYVVGFRPSRELRSARVGLQFASGTGPAVVGVRTNVPRESRDIFDPHGHIQSVVDDYVEYTWQNPQIARYCMLVWPR
jgi:hypothetical protein